MSKENKINVAEFSFATPEFIEELSKVAKELNYVPYAICKRLEQDKLVKEAKFYKD